MERAIFITKCVRHIFMSADERITLTHFLTTPSGIREIKIELDFRAERKNGFTQQTNALDYKFSVKCKFRIANETEKKGRLCA